jgi:membrane-anchored glycerophosphoryl diester phosphodiesterase (GDPDase)
MLKEVIKDIIKNALFYTSHLFIIDIVLGGVGLLILSEIFQLLLTSAGQNQITTTNISEFFLSPISILVLIFYVIGLMFLISIEFALIIKVIREKTLKISKENLNELYGLMKRSFSPIQIIAFLFYILINIPWAHFLLNSFFIESVYRGK